MRSGILDTKRTGDFCVLFFKTLVTPYTSIPFSSYEHGAMGRKCRFSDPVDFVEHISYRG